MNRRAPRREPDFGNDFALLARSGESFNIAFDVESLLRLQACQGAVAPQLRQIDRQLALYASQKAARLARASPRSVLLNPASQRQEQPAHIDITPSGSRLRVRAPPRYPRPPQTAQTIDTSGLIHPAPGCRWGRRSLWPSLTPRSARRIFLHSPAP
jgi:hypothetical protein